MKKYVSPFYSTELVEVNDIILLSWTEGVAVEQINETSANVSVSALDVLGRK